MDFATFWVRTSGTWLNAGAVLLGTVVGLLVAGRLSPRMREIMVRIIKDRHAKGQTFLIVSHDLPAVIDLGPRLVVMNAGSVIAEGPAERVLNDREVIEAYLGGTAA